MSDIVLQDLPEGTKLNRASWIRSRVPPEVNPLFSFFFFSVGLLLHDKVSDEVPIPSFRFGVLFHPKTTQASGIFVEKVVDHRSHKRNPGMTSRIVLDPDQI